MRLGIVFGALGIGLAACALALVPLALGKRNRATLPAVFEGTTVVYAVPFAGGRPHAVLRLHGQWEFPVVTRDGSALLLERPNLAKTGVWRVPLDGRRPTRVRELGVFTAPVARRGGYLATERQTRPASSGWRIDLVVRDRGNRVVWTRRMPFPIGFPAVAPDGRRVAVVRMHLLELVTPSGRRLLASDAQSSFAPVWAQDGRSLLYYDTSGQLVVRNSVSGATRVVVPRGRYYEEALSPDGRTVFFLGVNDAVNMPK
jgi:hypothetical protein